MAGVDKKVDAVGQGDAGDGQIVSAHIDRVWFYEYGRAIGVRVKID